MFQGLRATSGSSLAKTPVALRTRPPLSLSPRILDSCGLLRCANSFPPQPVGHGSPREKQEGRRAPYVILGHSFFFWRCTFFPKIMLSRLRAWMAEADRSLHKAPTTATSVNDSKRDSLVLFATDPAGVRRLSPPKPSLAAEEHEQQRVRHLLAVRQEVVLADTIVAARHLLLQLPACRGLLKSDPRWPRLLWSLEQHRARVLQQLAPHVTMAGRNDVFCLASATARLPLHRDVGQRLAVHLGLLAAQSDGIARRPASTKQAGTGQAYVVELIDPSLHAAAGRWVPAEFVVAARGCTGCFDVRIRSDINNLDRDAWPQLYEDLAQCFAAMMPQFCDVLGADWCVPPAGRAESAVHVIVKAQTYELPAGTTWEGRLHQEGTPQEHIAAAGIWYYDVPARAQLDGGALELTVPLAGRCGNQTAEVHQVVVCPQASIVFSNTGVYHRVGRMACPAEAPAPATRKILSFFVVDPAHVRDVPSSRLVSVNQRSRVLLQLASVLPRPAAILVVDYLLDTMGAARQLRERVRDARANAVDAESLVRLDCED